MHDIKWIRENPDAFDRGLARRGLEPQAKRLIALDEVRRAAIQKVEGAQARRNAASKEIGTAKKSKDDAKANELMVEVGALKDSIPRMEAEEKSASQALDDALAEIPNLPLDAVPDGKDEKDNVEHHHFGAKRGYAFTPKQHFELGEALSQMDFETAAKLSGARFVVLKKGLARLERALGQFFLDVHTGEHGYTEVSPPLLARNEVMFGTAQLPKFENDQFWAISGDLFLPYAEGDLETVGQETDVIALGAAFTHVQNKLRKLRLGLIPTAEVPLTNLVRVSIIDETQLPMRFTACTPCFRAEAGAAGKDTRGMIRQHQFTKVELVSITTPEQSKDEHERMLACAEEVLRRLDLHYRVMTLSTGDMGFASQKTYDIEVWLPGQNAYREISSCSICGEFQARRMNARYRSKEGRQVRHVHTLNGLRRRRGSCADRSDGNLSAGGRLDCGARCACAIHGRHKKDREISVRILVTNDDGIHAEGLDVCTKIARTLSEDVWIVAPEFDQSGVAHSLSLNDPLRLRQVEERRFAVRGTPTDCVIMGVRHVLRDKPPDLVLSGVNRGRNAGEDVIYSGTIAGAMEAAVLGIPSLALSQSYKSRSDQPPYWQTSFNFAPDIIRRVLAEGMPRDVLVNINFPDCRPEEVKGVEVTAQGRRRQERLHIDERTDGRGNPYYWIAYVRQAFVKAAGGTDLDALDRRRVAVTPLKLDMTDDLFRTKLVGLFGSNEQRDDDPES